MSSLTGKEIQIVTALSSINFSENLIDSSNIKDLIKKLTDANQKTQNVTENLQKIRQEREESNFLSNWWNNAEDKIKDAQIDLSTSVANLNKHSSQLLIFNTAISKILLDQQQLLLQQQKLLEQQAGDLKQQNSKIFQHQKDLQQQQEEISKANQGLLEAKGITSEQAQKLIRCVQRVEATENRINEVNNQLLLTIGEQIGAHLNGARHDWDLSLSAVAEKFNGQNKKILGYIQQQQHRINDQPKLHQELEKRIEHLEEAISAEKTKQFTQHMESSTQRAEIIEKRIETLIQQHSKLVNRVVLSVSALAVVLAGLTAIKFI